MDYPHFAWSTGLPGIRFLSFPWMGKNMIPIYSNMGVSKNRGYPKMDGF